MKTQKNPTSKNLIEQVTAHQLDGILAACEFAIIDVRSPEAIHKQGEIPGAFNLPFDKVEETLMNRHQDPDSIFRSNKPFLFCCTGGVMSYAAALKAQENGVWNVYNLEGGHAAWISMKKKETGEKAA